MLVAKQVADLITFTRSLLGVFLAWLGFEQGKEGLILATWLLLLDWTGDLFDGRIARRSRIHYHSWIGDRDLEVDMVVSAGLLFYLVASGFLNAWAAIFYILLWGAIFWRLGIPRSLGMLFQAPIYASFIWISIQNTPLAGYWILLWILVAIIGTWPLFPKTVVPGFLQGIREALLSRYHANNH